MDRRGRKKQKDAAASFMSRSITQDMAYRQSLMKYAVSRSCRKYSRNRLYIRFWRTGRDGSASPGGGNFLRRVFLTC